MGWLFYIILALIEIPSIYTCIELVERFLEEKERGDPAARSLELLGSLVVSCHFMKNCSETRMMRLQVFLLFLISAGVLTV